VSGGGEERLRPVELEHAQHDCRVDQRQQVVDLDGELVGEVAQVGLAVMLVDDFDQPGKPPTVAARSGWVSGPGAVVDAIAVRLSWPVRLA
jgi:hypothetical protein